MKIFNSYLEGGKYNGILVNNIEVYRLSLSHFFELIFFKWFTKMRLFHLNAKNYLKFSFFGHHKNTHRWNMA